MGMDEDIVAAGELVDIASDLSSGRTIRADWVADLHPLVRKHGLGGLLDILGEVAYENGWDRDAKILERVMNKVQH